MKLLFTEGIGASQTTTNAQDEKIPVYETKTAAENDLANLEVGQIIATKDEGSELSNPVDVVQDGNMHAVTSNAVADGLDEVMPTGTILPGMWETAPKGFLLCDGATYQTSQYPGLASVLGATSDTFKVPDLREVVLVGVGQNSTFTISAHDIYTLGQFKDDRIQGHRHSWSGVENVWSTDPPGGVTFTSGAPRGPVGFSIGGPISDGTNGSPRIGTTTHGKQYGVNYIIKY